MGHSLGAFVLAALVAGSAEAARIEVDEDTWVDVGFFLQTRADLVERGTPDGESVGKDLYLRRVRLNLSGRLDDRISFAFNTESAFLGRDDLPAEISVLDARGTWTVGRELEVDFGLLLTPSLHNGNQSAATLHTLDFHTAVFRYPIRSSSSRRDVGVQARGLLWGDRIQYRAGLFRGTRGQERIPGEEPTGARGLNPADAPRFSGALRFNFLDPEPSYLFAGIYFAERSVLSLGFAGEWQQDAARDARGRLTDWSWGGADLFLDLPVGADQEVVGQVAFSHWESGEGAANTGDAWYGDLGYRIHRLSVYAAHERFAAEAPAGDLRAWRGGAVWWIDRHSTNLKAELGRHREGGADWQWVGSLQLQLRI